MTRTHDAAVQVATLRANFNEAHTRIGAVSSTRRTRGVSGTPSHGGIRTRELARFSDSTSGSIGGSLQARQSTSGLIKKSGLTK